MKSNDLPINQTLNLHDKNSSVADTSLNPSDDDIRFTPPANPAPLKPEPAQTATAPTASTQSTTEFQATQNQIQSNLPKPKILMVFFSHPGENENVGTVQEGNTKIVSRNISIFLKTRGFDVDTFELVSSIPYSANYQATSQRAKLEQTNPSTVGYLGEVNNFYQYAFVFLGYPIWHDDMPMIVYDFLEIHGQNFTDQGLIPFCTHERSGDAGTFAKLKQITNANEVLDGLALTGQSARTPDSHPQILEWLKNLGF